MNRPNARKGDNTVVPIHALLQTTLGGGGTFGTGLNPNLLGTLCSQRLLVESDAWAHYRILDFKFRIHRDVCTGLQAVGVVGGVQDTNPGTVQQIMELLPSTVMLANYTKPSDWITVSKSELAGPLPWYKTVPGTADTTEEYPAALMMFGPATDVIDVEIIARYEFKTSVSPANTPEEAQLVARLREIRKQQAIRTEKSRLLQVLTGPTKSPP